VEDFVGEVTRVLQWIDGNRLSRESLREILTEFQHRLREQMAANQVGVGAAPIAPIIEVNNRPENERRYNVHYYGGKFHRLPEDWRFPRCGVFAVWRQWWIGDNVRHIPPLRDLEAKEYKHLDKIPLSEDEMHGRTGLHKNNRRKSRRTLCDLRYLIKFISKYIGARNVFRPEITPENVAAMFNDIADIFTDSERDAQKIWVSAVGSIRRRHGMPESDDEGDDENDDENDE
jgi:hypothetical protein